VLIALQSRINGELSNQMGDSLGAALVSFGTGLIFVSLISLFRKDVRAGFADIFKAVKSKQLPMWRLSAGMLGASFVAMQTHVVPIAGVALFTVASLAGQTAISLWVDHVGLAGGIKSVISKRRVIAAIITVGAVVSAIEFLAAKGATDITAICILAAPEGIAVLEKAFVASQLSLKLVTGALDERLNEKGYIVPGLGDAGDRLYGVV
jgi:transporter family-2 protein